MKNSFSLHLLDAFFSISLGNWYNRVLFYHICCRQFCWQFFLRNNYETSGRSGQFHHSCHFKRPFFLTLRPPTALILHKLHRKLLFEHILTFSCGSTFKWHGFCRKYFEVRVFLQFWRFQPNQTICFINKLPSLVIFSGSIVVKKFSTSFFLWTDSETRTVFKFFCQTLELC